MAYTIASDLTTSQPAGVSAPTSVLPFAGLCPFAQTVPERLAAPDYISVQINKDLSFRYDSVFKVRSCLVPLLPYSAAAPARLPRFSDSIKDSIMRARDCQVEAVAFLYFISQLSSGILVIARIIRYTVSAHTFAL